MTAIEKPNVVIVGAGPAGLMAAESLARRGHRVTVFDRMPTPGRKLLMAGRGGLNLTHTEAMPQFLARYGTSAAWLEPCIGHFAPATLIAWAEALGQSTFVGTSGRVFPKSMKASPLLRAWLARLAALGVELRVGHRWTGWTPEGDLRFVLADGEVVTVRPGATLLALGGASWPRLGSDGAWVRLLAAEGIAVAELLPSNMAIEIGWSAMLKTRFEGEALKRIAISYGGQSVRGEAVITARGLEGGSVYALAGRIRDAGPTPAAPVVIAIDLRPDLSVDTLAAALAGRQPKQSTSSFLARRAKLAPAAISILHEGHGSRLPADPLALAAAIKAVPLKVHAVSGLERAISSAGGVRRDSIDEHFMLREKPGVFVAGEMLDWEAPTGGYLLQATFATAIAAADGIDRWLASN